MEPDLSGKTVIVLDHGSYFAQPCHDLLEMDISGRGKSASSTKPIVVNKSMWTCSLEACFEYSRIVRDLFPGKDERMIRFLVCDQDCRWSSTSWSHHDNTEDQIQEFFMKIGPPSTDKSADKAQTVMTDAVSMAVKEIVQTPNGVGRIVVLTHIKSPEEVTTLVEKANQTLKSSVASEHPTSSNSQTYVYQ